MVALLWTAGPGVALAFLVWAELLRRHSSVSVTASLLLTPVVAGLVGLALLGEPMSAVELVGGAVVLAGVALISRGAVLERPP
jgi:drug/metabolite transporter (DMT)-like permease